MVGLFCEDGGQAPSTQPSQSIKSDVVVLSIIWSAASVFALLGEERAGWFVLGVWNKPDGNVDTTRNHDFFTAGTFFFQAQSA